MSDLIDRQALYERAVTLEAQALNYVSKLIERDGDEFSTEWKIWSAILTERTAFTHDIYDAPSAQPTIEPKHGHWVKPDNSLSSTLVRCSVCSRITYNNLMRPLKNSYDYCPWCGARMDEVE